MGRMSHRNQERTERRISAAASLMLCALTVLAQIAVTLLLTRFLKEKASFVYGFLQLIGAAVAIRVYQRSGSPSYKLSWMCLLLILPVAGMLLFCLWGGTHQAKQLSLKPVPPIPQRESAKMLSDLNQTALLEEILKEAVINRRDERIELEQRKHDEERRDEHIAPFGIADGADFLFCSLHPESPILPTFVCPNDDLWHPAGVGISLPEVTIGTECNFLRKASRDGRNARPCRLVCDANYSASGHWKFTSSGYFSEMMLSNCALASSMVALPSK